MKILVLNGSPRPQGSTKDMVNAFKKGAESAGHTVDVVITASIIKEDAITKEALILMKDGTALAVSCL